MAGRAFAVIFTGVLPGNETSPCRVTTCQTKRPHGRLPGKRNVPVAGL
ncbi:MAG: hypothetical protein WAP27_07830 [Tepidanaerobacteraceae bacterium]